jgi:hypothetical protein
LATAPLRCFMPPPATAAREPPPAACGCATSLVRCRAKRRSARRGTPWRARATLREALSECGRAATALVFVHCRGSAWPYGADAPVGESGSFAAALRKRAAPAVKAPPSNLNLQEPFGHGPPPRCFMPLPATAARELPPTARWCTAAPTARVVGPNGVRPVGARHGVPVCPW